MTEIPRGLHAMPLYDMAVLGAWYTV